MTPRKFVLCTWEGGGSVGPVIAVARKLVERGHHVRVMSDRCNRLEAESVGAAFVPWTQARSRPDRTPATDHFRDWEAASPPEEFKLLVDKLLTGPALDYARDLLLELERESADLVVTSEMLLGVMAACEAAGQPLAIFTCNVSIFPVPGIPPMGPGLAPPRNEEERRLHQEIAEGSLELFDSGLPALNAAREKLALAPLQSVVDQLKAADRLYLGTARAFDFEPGTLPPGWSYCGPQLLDPAWSNRPLPGRRGDRPLVVVAFSTTFQNHADVLQRVADALGRIDAEAIVTLGDGIAPGDISAPGNVTLVHSAPHSRLMPEADLVVTHGGHGTVIRALVEGKPMLLLPHGRDQHDNAVRVTERGAGLALSKTASADEIGAAIERLLGDRGFAEAARKLGAAVREEAERSTLVEDLEALAAPPARPRAEARRETFAPPLH